MEIVINNTTVLPTGIVSLKRGDELLWSEGTGRGATSGLLVGSVIAAKQTYSVEWGVLNQALYSALLRAIPNDFFTITIRTANTTHVSNLTVYRGAISGEFVASLTQDYWKNVKVDFIQR